MHDLDRTQLELESDDFESEGEYADEYESEYAESFDTEEEGPFSEEEEMEMAAELLEVSDEEELDQFLGKLLRKAGKAVGRFVRSDTGRALGGILKRAAKKALPVVGRAVGGSLAGPAGARIGGRLAPMAGRMFGLELEGLSMEDQEYEVAKRVVRLAGAAAKKASLSPLTGSPLAQAQKAVVSAARHHAPGLLKPTPGKPASMNGFGRQSGRWFRRGRRIVVLGV